MRFVFLHNHILKNAGSTIDHVFESAGFVNTPMEVSPASESIYPRMILDLVQRDPRVEYISSHVMRSPRLADAEGIGFIDITFVRHPIDRLYSIYRYFRKDGTRDFPMIDKGVSFSAFVDAIAVVAPAHLHSPQTSCLGNERNFYFPPNRVHLERAKSVISDTRFLGVVDLFEMGFEVFMHCCGSLITGKDLRAFSAPFPSINRSSDEQGGIESNLGKIKEEVGDRRYSHIERANEMDMELYRFAREELIRRHHLVGGPAS